MRLSNNRRVAERAKTIAQNLFVSTTPTQTVTTPPVVISWSLVLQHRRHSQVSRSAFDRRLSLVACFVSDAHPLMVTSDTTQQLDG